MVMMDYPGSEWIRKTVVLSDGDIEEMGFDPENLDEDDAYEMVGILSEGRNANLISWNQREGILKYDEEQEAKGDCWKYEPEYSW